MSRSLFLLVCAFYLTTCDSVTESATGQGARSQVEGEEQPPAHGATRDRSFTFVPGQRFGPFAAGMDTAEMKRVLGPEYFREFQMYVGEGQRTDGLVLYYDQDARVEILPSPADLPDDIEPSVDLMVRDPGSPWHMAGTGIGVGSSLRELERVNGRPFKISGFDWDYGGYVYDWNGGALENLGIRLGYEIRPQYDETILDQLDVLGDVELSSDDGFTEWLDVRVSEVRVTL